MQPKRPLIETGIGRSDGVREFLAFVLVLISMADWLLVGLGVASPRVGLVLGVVTVSAACAMLFGRKAGWFVVLCTAALGWYVVLPPVFSFAVADQDSIWILFGVVAAAGITNWAVGYRRAPQ